MAHIVRSLVSFSATLVWARVNDSVGQKIITVIVSLIPPSILKKNENNSEPSWLICAHPCLSFYWKMEKPYIRVWFRGLPNSLCHVDGRPWRVYFSLNCFLTSCESLFIMMMLDYILAAILIHSSIANLLLGGSKFSCFCYDDLIYMDSR